MSPEQLLQVRAIMEIASNGIVMVDRSGIIVLVNSHTERIFGYTSGELLGQRGDFLVPELFRNGFFAKLKPSTTGAGCNLFGRRKDGSEFPIELDFNPFTMPTVNFVIISITDISERKWLEASLASKEHIALGARSDRISARVMFAINQQDTVNAAAAEVLRVLADDAGYCPLAYYEYDEWKGGLVLFAGISLAPGDEQKSFKVGEGLVGEAASQKKPMFVDAAEHRMFALHTGVGILEQATLFVLPLVHQDKLIGVIAGASHTHLEEDDCSWLLVMIEQISVRLYALRQFQELKALSALLNERSRKIEAQNRELAHASRQKSEFLASMSHELRTPLNAIIGFSEVLKNGMVGALAPKQLDYVNEIFQSGRHLLSLINDILDLSKIEAGKMELTITQLKVASLIKNAVTTVREMAAKTGVTLIPPVFSDHLVLEADERKLLQIVYNLLSNAVKFTPKGGTVGVYVADRGPYVEIAVTDSGIGISPEDQKRLFRAFEQIDTGLNRKFDGSGLGLAMVKRLVNLHGGTLGVESEVGKGSRFWVRLPRAKISPPIEVSPLAPVSGAPMPPPAYPCSKITKRISPPTKRKQYILVIDDEAVARDLLRIYFEDAGFVVITAASGEEAIVKLEGVRPDLVTLDLKMSGMDGFAVLKAMRDSIACNTPVLSISGSENPEKAIALGGQAVLSKPVQKKELLDAVTDLLSKHGNDREYVLIVDDDPKAVKIITSYLSEEPIEVGFAYGGREGLACIEARCPDLLILDLVMPEITGFVVLSELRSDPKTLDLPVIILTAKDLTHADRLEIARSAQALHEKASTTRVDLVTEVRRMIANRARGEGAGDAKGSLG